MLYSVSRVSIVIALIAVSLVSQVAAAVPAAMPTGIAASGARIAGPISDGRYVVWSTNRTIYAHDLVTRKTEPIASGDPNIGANWWCTEAAIDDGIVVWSHPTGELNGDGKPLFAITARDLPTGATTDITRNADAQCPVQIDEGRVTYDSEGATWLHDLGSAEPARQIWTNDDGLLLGLAGDWVVGLQDLMTNPDEPFIHERLLARHLVTGDVRVLDEGWVDGNVPFLGGVVDGLIVYGRLAPSPDAALDLGGGWLAVTGLDWTSAQYFARSGSCRNPGVRVTGNDGYLIASCYEDTSTGGTDLWVVDLHTVSSFTVTLDPDGIITADLAAGAVFWSQQDHDRYTVRSIPWSEALPSARQADPGVVRPEAAYYAETGHSLQLGFKGYWERHGGLPVFGYPMTEEYDEWNADIGRFRVTQYLERQRFEWHWENEGTPYQVLLGRLGYEHAARLNLLETDPFRYLGNDEGPDAGCVYFRETGHYACHDFLVYWQEHGLDFGDPGTSFRESLALFGYPLSEPFTTTNADDHTVVTQYFERAVFELHPENVYPYRILLRRLGVEALDDRGW
jgi:hypothetical protein